MQNQNQSYRFQCSNKISRRQRESQHEFPLYIHLVQNTKHERARKYPSWACAVRYVCDSMQCRVLRLNPEKIVAECAHINALRARFTRKRPIEWRQTRANIRKTLNKTLTKRSRGEKIWRKRDTTE